MRQKQQEKWWQEKEKKRLNNGFGSQAWLFRASSLVSWSTSCSSSNCHWGKEKTHKKMHDDDQNDEGCQKSSSTDQEIHVLTWETAMQTASYNVSRFGSSSFSLNSAMESMQEKAEVDHDMFVSIWSCFVALTSCWGTFLLLILITFLARESKDSFLNKKRAKKKEKGDENSLFGPELE